MRIVRDKAALTARASSKMPFTNGELEAILAAMLERVGRPQADLELAIIGDAAMEQVQSCSSGHRGPTNILSFRNDPAAPHADAPAFIGWLVLSADTLGREAFLYDQDLNAHCVRLLAHGLAHLLGFDHGPEMFTLCAELEDAATCNHQPGRKP